MLKDILLLGDDPVVIPEDHIWVISRGKRKNVREMSTHHIKNCIKCINGEGSLYIPKDFLGGHDKWLQIFSDELKRRADFSPL